MLKRMFFFNKMDICILYGICREPESSRVNEGFWKKERNSSEVNCCIQMLHNVILVSSSYCVICFIKPVYELIYYILQRLT